MKATKRITRLCSILLAVVIVMAMSISSAFAAMKGSLTGGTITINNAVPGQTYSIYQIAYIESYSGDHYAYKANSEWTNWLSTATTTVNGEQVNYVTVDQQGYVTWNEKVGTDADVYAAFAKAAKEYAKTLTAIDTKEAPAATEPATTSTVVFGDTNPEDETDNSLKLGWYLVDSSVGALCSLDTTNPTATINEKNEVPTIKKEATNDTDKSSPSVGDTVNYQITIDAKPGAEKYVLHDAMGDGLDLDASSIQVYVGSVAEGNELPAISYTTTTTGLTDGCDFEIAFTDAYLSSITSNTTIIVTYNATINEDAITGTDPVTNKAILDYGDDQHVTEGGTTTTEVYSFDLAKVDSAYKLLDGAQFELYESNEPGAQPINFVKTNEGYRVADKDDQDQITTIDVSNGRVTIDGLGTGTYYLKEIKAPNGYNMVDGFTNVVIGQTDNSFGENKITGDEENGYTLNPEISGGVFVVNKTGSELPSTGGMGTTAIYIVGGVLVAGAAVLLVTRRRMHA